MSLVASSNTVWNTLGKPGVFQTVLELRSWPGGSAAGPVPACVFEVRPGSGPVALCGGAEGGGAVAPGGVDTGSATRRAGVLATGVGP